MNAPEPHTYLVINGGIGGGAGNTAVLLDHAADLLRPHGTVLRIDLDGGEPDVERWTEFLAASNAVVVGTGTYWDSWGSPLQRFLEAMTPTEGTELWLGKPAAAVITMHSVGGKGVLSRLQGVLNTFGSLIPPASGIVCSAAGHLAIRGTDSPLTDDLWRPEDLEVVCGNLVEACRGGRNWRTWPVDRTGFDTRWAEIDPAT